MVHSRSGSAQLNSTPERRSDIKERPKSMFARLSPGQMSPAPHVPEMSPKRRMKRFSLMLRPTAETVEPVSPLRTPLRTPSLNRSGSLQVRRYKYEDQNEEWPPANSPRRSLCSVTSPSQTPQRNSYLATPRTMPLFSESSPKLETQSSVWIADEKRPRGSLDRGKRTSLLGRSLSVRSPQPDKGHKKTLSNGKNMLGSPLISSPLLVETSCNFVNEAGATIPLVSTGPSTPVTAAPVATPATPVAAPVRSRPVAASKMAARAPAMAAAAAATPSSPKPAKTPKKGMQLLLKLFRKSTPSSPSTSTLASEASVRVHTPVIGSARNSMVLSRGKSVKRSKAPHPQDQPQTPQTPQAAHGPQKPPHIHTGQSRKFPSTQTAAVIAPSRPTRTPGLGLFRRASQLSLQSSNDSRSTGDLVTPTNKTSSPRVLIQDWEYSSMNQRQWEESFSEKHRGAAPAVEWI